MSDKQTSFLPVFETLASQNQGAMTIIGDTLIVEELNAGPATKEISTADGRKVSLVLESEMTNRQLGSIQDDRPMYVRVLAAGAGYDDNGADVPCDAQVGDILLIGKLSVKWLSTFGPLLREGSRQIGLARDSDALIRFRGQEGFDKVNSILAGLK